MFYLTIVILYLLAFTLGAAIGSFLGVVIERLPKKQKITGRSHCACGRQLTWYENIPIIGYIRAKGVAQCCGATIPQWYQYIEIGAATLTLITFHLFFVTTLLPTTFS